MYDVDNAREGLKQENIDAAFCRNIERGKIVTDIADHQVWRIHGKDTSKAGVIRMQVGGMEIPVTNLERTLIDIVVQPGLSGGMHEVINAYENARGNDSFSITKIIHYLKQISYVYPYHQSIGFLLELTGQDPNTLEGLRTQFPYDYDFYLLHTPLNKNRAALTYFKKWRLFVPKDLSSSWREWSPKARLRVQSKS